jgi:hypothetical protein
MLVLSLFACEKEKVFKLNNEFSIKKGETVTLKDGKSVINLKLIAINDSRCPKDVVCVRAGEAIVKFDIDINNKKYTNNELCIQCDSQFPIPSNITIDNYNISLMAVNPYPESSNSMVEKSAIMVIK